MNSLAPAECTAEDEGATPSSSCGPDGREPGAPSARLLGIAGSLRRDSYNCGLIRAAAELVPKGTTLEIYDRLGELPPFNEDDEKPPPDPVADLRRRIDAADAVLVSTPEYNHSIPGVLKNAVDWASRPPGDGALDGAIVAVVGASPSRYGAAWAQEELRKVLEACGAEVLDGQLPVSHASERFQDGRLIDDRVRARLTKIVGDLARTGVAPPS